MPKHNPLYALKNPHKSELSHDVPHAELMYQCAKNVCYCLFGNYILVYDYSFHHMPSHSFLSLNKPAPK